MFSSTVRLYPGLSGSDFPGLSVDVFIIEYIPTQDKPPLKYVFKRITSAHVSYKPTPLQTDYTVLLTTGIGTGTETWLPSVKHLFALQMAPQSKSHIRAFWALDTPNQGDSVRYNDQILCSHYSERWCAQYFGRAIKEALTSGVMDIGGSRLVGFSHSVGITGLIAAIEPHEQIPYHALLLAEPNLVPRKAKKFLEKIVQVAITRTQERCDIWPSKEEARKALMQRRPTNSWHPDVLEALLDYGLRDLPTAEYPHEKGVTTLVSKQQEIATYRNFEENYRTAELATRFFSSIPVHIIWGERKNFLPAEVQALLSDPNEGRKAASEQEIKDAGHCVLQEKPYELAERLFQLLEDMSVPRNKL
ncbi:hypothetical protein M422DRAFT_275536 [Sphaerobolus stellatus SS14]|uniref:AB hydrolase-1 domain-containing protein n=1 Tax=Sphaerobolus stellatus (strain SS14) TaxID=990650 RepID=A0A0C9UF43_SPHS4|nr:hypothetical protein M422DRAFT_275536 [Sphaerobolus stellatus SS14]